MLHGIATGELRSRHSGACVLLPRRGSMPIALPVPRQACLGLARAVLAGAAGEPPVVPLWRVAGGDPAIAVWLASWERDSVVGGVAGEDGVGRGRSPVPRDRRPSPLGPLAAAFVIPGGREVVQVIDAAAWHAFVGGEASVEAAPGSGATAGVIESRREQGRRWLARIDAGEVVAGPATGTAADGPAEEASLAVDAVAMAAAHEDLVSRFGEGVAEARLEAMRELAYGAGHEINNPLANIATRAQALLLEEEDPERRRRLATIVDQSFRARDMIGGLMLFARPPKPKPAAVDAAAIVAAVVAAIAPQAAARGVKLEVASSAAGVGLPSVVLLVDRAQVEEAVRAIAVNALEAVEPSGTVVLAVFRRTAPAGEGCGITVLDRGRGMDAETMRRAFDPFFSGREAGRGAGLGLSKAWRLIESNGGQVVLESRPGHGTLVTVTLPEAR